MNAGCEISVEAPETAPVLLVSPDPADSCCLREMLANMDCELVSASDSTAAEKLLRDRGFQVVITDRDLPDGDWLKVLRSVQCLNIPPRLIVFSRMADEHLWADVLNRLGFDVLPKPFVRSEVCRVMGHALSRRTNLVPKPAASSRAGTRIRRASA